jgi:transcriptional regulator with XRE-family HTH domain
MTIAAEARSNPMATVEQIRAGRALLGWSQGDLAEHAGLSQTGIARIENGTNRPNTTTLEKILRAFDREDVEMIGAVGVKRRTGEVRMLSGRAGFVDFLDDITETLAGGGDLCVFNGNVHNWLTWADQAQIDAYYAKMCAIKDKITARAIIRKGNTFRPSTVFGCTYRSSDDAEYDDQNAFYCYGDKLAFVSFAEGALHIAILQKPQFAIGFRTLFNAMWNTAQDA